MTPARSRILIADDDPSIRRLVSSVVSRHHFAIDCVSDGEAAIDRLMEHDYAVILIDLVMPRGGGFAVIEHLRRQPQERKPVVLVITGYADQSMQPIDAHVVSAVVRKPFEVSELGSIIRLCISGFESQARLHRDPDPCRYLDEIQSAG